jgi:putative phage-type endonuclease
VKLIKVESEEHFLELHRSVIGASKAAAILGLNPYRSAYDQWAHDLGLVPPIEDNEAMYWGRTLEPMIVDKAAQKLGLTVETGWFGISEAVPYIGCQFDALAFDSARNIVAVLEVKNIGGYASSGWGEDFSDQVPDQYNLQVQHQLWLAQEGASQPIQGYLAALLGGNKHRVYAIPYKPEIMAAILPRYAEYKRCLDERVEPEITGAESTFETIRSMYPDTTGEEVEAPAKILPEIANWKRLAGQIKVLEAKEQEAKNRIAAEMRDIACVTGDFGKITFKPQRTVAWAQVAATFNPPDDLVEKFAKNTRSIRPYWAKEKP